VYQDVVIVDGADRRRNTPTVSLFKLSELDRYLPLTRADPTSWAELARFRATYGRAQIVERSVGVSWNRAAR
jgi:hypothetical protein